MPLNVMGLPARSALVLKMVKKKRAPRKKKVAGGDEKSLKK